MSGRQFFHSYQFRILFVLFAFLSISFISIAVVGRSLLAEVSERERGNYLTSFTKVLDAEIPDGGYDEILEELELTNASREEKIIALQNYLTPISDYISTLAPGLGVGYYSNEFDAILTYAPSSSYSHLVGVQINEDHPGREVMSTNKLMVNRGAMVRGEILNAMLPIERQGEVIGYIWSNQLAQDLDEEFGSMINRVWTLLALCFFGTSFLLLVLAMLFFKELSILVSGIDDIEKGVADRIPQLKGKLGEVVQRINTFTEEATKSTAESAKALITLQNILDHIELGIFIFDTKKKEIVYANKFTQTELGFKGILGETFSQLFYNSEDVCSSACFDENGVPNFDLHTREHYIQEMQMKIYITERLITWHDGRLVLMLSVSQINS